MSISSEDWQQEQRRVDHVVQEINKRLHVLQQDVGEIRADIVDIRQNFWDDVTMNLDDISETGETSIALKQQAEVLSERERSHRHAENEFKKLTRLRKTPYFGRIDFVEQGESAVERIYLGIASFLDEQDEEFLVYDWRAPVSSLYYDYGPGPAVFETPGGTVSGEIELKRQFVIRAGRIRSLFDTGVTIGDELLQEVLGQQADAQMKSIVATIQKEQNLIIRNERSRLLIVQGAAGSGKTSAALQRVAYLLYRYRETLSAEQIVLFSPNPMFNSYISTVLPELGEENMQQTTFQDYLEQRLGPSFALEDPFTQMEYVLAAPHEPGYAARIAGIRYKASTDFMALLAAYAEQLGREGLPFQDVEFEGEVYLAADRIRELFYALDRSLSLPKRMKLLTDQLLEQLQALALAESKKRWVEEAIELLDKEDYIRVHQKLRKQNRYSEDNFDYHDHERELLAEMVVRKRFKPLRAQVKKRRFLDAPAMYRQLFAAPQVAARFAPGDLPEQWPEICRQTLEKLAGGELAYEDATPYLDLKERVEGFQTNTQVKHVFLDEAQDYSPFQFAFLKRLFPYSKMTVLGDLNQSIYAHAQAGADGFAAVAALFGAEQTETIRLTRSYRSTEQIVELTRSLVAGGEQIEPFTRSGDKPTATHAADAVDLAAKIVARIRELETAGHQTIAVICKTAQESRAAYDALHADIPLRLIRTETSTFEKGVVVIPAALAKGVEFDAVILYDASATQYGRESERKLFYTACTRAMHELHLFFVGEMSPFLAAAPANTYVFAK